MKKHLIQALTIMGIVISVSSCKKDDDGPSVTTPDTYSFENVDFKESQARLKMLDAVNKYMSTAQATATKVALDATKANNLWNNTGSPYDTVWLNSAGVSIAEKTADVAIFKGYLDKLVTLSNQPLTPAANGTAGYIARNAGKILVDEKGLEYVQAVQKGTMGALLFKEGIALLDKVPTADNNTATAGKGTAMAHNFDLAFGYFSLPVNYDTSAAFATANRSALLFWGNYIRERGLYIKAHDAIWKAFRTGRAAIVAKNYKVVNEQVAILKETWEKVAAAAAWAYIDMPQSQSGQLASQFHGLSEGFGFIAALKYRSSSSKLTEANYQKLVTIMNTNFYDLVGDASFAKLKEAKEILRAAYGQLQAQ